MQEILNCVTDFFIYNIIIITTDNIFLHASFNYNKLFSQPPRKQINKNKP